MTGSSIIFPVQDQQLRQSASLGNLLAKSYCFIFLICVCLVTGERVGQVTGKHIGLVTGEHVSRVFGEHVGQFTGGYIG